MDFADGSDRFDTLHCAFITSDDEFDAVLDRVRAEVLSFGSGRWALEDGEINHLYDGRGGRGFYFRDPNGHVLEVVTHTYV
jgi:catechol 2,3-dioxygenase-like lactoylglutathione lyase family enzyme